MPYRIIMNLKKCTKCNLEKDKNEFIKKCGMCKPCRSIHRKEYRLKNIEKFKIKDKKYYEKNKERIRKKDDEYYEKNKEKIRAQRKEYRINNIEKHKQKQKEYYYNNIQKRLGITYRNRVREKLKSGKGYIDYLGCSIPELIAWFEFNFALDNDFTWDNYGKVWEIDHVIPCATFNLLDKDHIYKCFNWKNTKPVQKNFNRKKNSKIVINENFEQELRLHIYIKKQGI
jgi:hypothetical protein